MRKESLLQNYFKDTFSFMHKKRQNVLFGAVDSLMDGANLALSSLGRNFKGKAKERHQICKMDRLLGNKHLHREIRTIYKAINKLTMVSSLSVICVDWSCLSYADGVYLLRASIKIHCRSLVCYQEVHPKEHENNEIAHNLFLDNLKMTVAGKIVQYYAYRMQIEEEFRDTKSTRFGFGLSDSRTKIHARINVLLIINMLASIYCWVIACSAIKKKKHVDYHANSSKKFNVLSAIKLGKRIYKKIKNFSIYHFRVAFSYWIKLINGDLLYGEIL